MAKAKGEYSTLTPDGRALVDTNRLIRSAKVQSTLTRLEQKIRDSQSRAQKPSFHK